MSLVNAEHLKCLLFFLLINDNKTYQIMIR